MNVTFLTVNGKEVKLEFEEEDFSKNPQIRTLKLNEHPGVKYLVFCDPTAKRIVVDESAPSWYKHMAVLHETICALHKYEFFICQFKDIKFKCRAIERFVTYAFPEYSQEYIEARKQMFNLLLNQGLNNDIRLIPTYEWLKGATCS